MEACILGAMQTLTQAYRKAPHAVSNLHHCLQCKVTWCDGALWCKGCRLRCAACMRLAVWSLVLCALREAFRMCMCAYTQITNGALRDAPNGSLVPTRGTLEANIHTMAQFSQV